MPLPHASRLDRVAASGTVKITDIVNRLRSEGREILAFNVGEPDFDTPDVIKEAAKESLDQGETGYTSAWGLPDLRDAIAEKSREDNGIPAETKHVLVAPAKQAIFYSIFGSVEEGDEVLIPDPAWVSYEPLVNLAGATPVRVPAGADVGFRLTPERVAEHVTEDTRLLVMVSPSNPTGAMMTHDDIHGVADLARDHGFDVLSDELYERITYEREPLSPASLDGMFERTLTVNGFSKGYAMTGWRLGWLVARRELLEQVIKLQQHTLTHPTTFAMRAGVTALQMDETPLDAMVEEFRARRDLLVKGMNDIDGVECPLPDGAFYAFPRFDVEATSQQLSEHLLMSAGIATTPGSAFGPGGEGHLRFSYAASRETIGRMLDLLPDALDEVQ